MAGKGRDMAAIIGALLMAVGAGTFTVLVKGGYVRRIDLLGWAGATFCTVGGLMTVIGAMLEEGNTDGVILLAVLFSLAAFTGAIVYAMRHRAPAEPETAQAPRTNYIHAYGTYDANTVRDARAQAQQLRRGARA